jgi:putative DNA primase/helicase
VALAVRKHHPGQRIVICADNDRHTAANPGLTKAREAALAVGGFVSVPEFPEGAEGTDFNDLAALRRRGAA